LAGVCDVVIAAHCQDFAIIGAAFCGLVTKIVAIWRKCKQGRFKIAASDAVANSG
jgi:hypothetical protein